MKYIVIGIGLISAIAAAAAIPADMPVFKVWVLAGAIGLVVIWFFWPDSTVRSSNPDVLRGTEFVPANELQKKYHENDEAQIWIGEIPVPRAFETYHFGVFGSIGQGKTLLFHHVVNTLRGRGVKAIIHDPKPDYLQVFFNPETDLIFNPMDSRTLAWNIFAEIEAVYDIENICASIIPENPRDPHWSNAPRDILAGVIQHLYESGQKTNLALWDMVADAAGLIETVREKKLPGYQHLVNDRHANDVISALAEHTRCLRYLATMNVSVEKSFSFKKYFADNSSRFIFLTNFKKVQKAISPLLTLFIDVAGRHVHGLDDSRGQSKIFFVLDEFKDLQRLDSLSELIVEGRSKGASVWIAGQDVHQIDELYGRERRATLMSSLSSHVVFRVGDPDTAKYFSQAIGEQQLRRWHTSTGSHSSGIQGGKSETTSEHITTEAAIMPTEIMNLQTRQCIVRLMNTEPTITYIPTDMVLMPRHDGFVENPVFRLRQNKED